MGTQTASEPAASSKPGEQAQQGGAQQPQEQQQQDQQRQQHKRPRMEAGRSAVGNMLEAMAALQQNDKYASRRQPLTVPV